MCAESEGRYTKSEQASLHLPCGRVRRCTVQSNHRLNLTVTSVAKVCYEHIAHVQAHVHAHTHVDFSAVTPKTQTI